MKQKLPAWMTASFRADTARARRKSARWQASMLRVYADLAEMQPVTYAHRRWFPMWCCRLWYRLRKRNLTMWRKRRYPHGATLAMRKAADTIEWLLEREA